LVTPRLPRYDDLTFKIARKRFAQGKSVGEIAVEEGLDPSTVRRRLRQATEMEIIHVLVTPPIHHLQLTNLQIEVQERFQLKDAIIFPGLEDVMDEESSPEKEAVLIDCCRRAAEYLVGSLKDGNTLAVPWGRVAYYISGQLSPRVSLHNLAVVPIVGVMGVRTHPYEANTIAARIASSFGGHSYLLPAPAVVDSSSYDTVTQLPLVREAVDKAKKADVLFTPIAAPNPEASTIVRMGLATEEQVRRMKEQGAVGEIASYWWFDKNGKPIKAPDVQPVGVGPEEIYDIVEQGGTVIAVVAASKERIAPLKVALEQRMANVVITDHVTALELLRVI